MIRLEEGGGGEADFSAVPLTKNVTGFGRNDGLWLSSRRKAKAVEIGVGKGRISWVGGPSRDSSLRSE
jgi:hypothetical protein